MYAVSNGYKTAMLAPVQERDLKGTIGSQTFVSSDVLAGSFCVSNAAMESTSVSYGAVYVGELDMTMVPTFSLTRGTWRGQTIIPQIGLKVNGSYEYVPVGVFTIFEAKWSTSGVELIAYDNMAFFDVAFPGREECNHKTPYQYLSAACTACGVTLKNTQAEIEALPNGDIIFDIYEENNIETWRDLISVVAQVLAAFATIDRNGYLEIRTFGADTGLSLDATKRFVGAAISDYITHYTGVGVVLTQQNKYHYHSAQVDDGAVMKLGENPLLQYPLSAQVDLRLDEILTALADFEFVPFTVSMLGDIAFDLGDVVTYTGGIAASGGDPCCIMAYTYTYGRGYACEGYGDNPALTDGRSKTDKSLDGIRDTVIQQSKDITELKESAIRFLLPSDTNDDPIDDGDTNQILQWDFENAEGAEIAINATIGFTIETTAVADTTYGDAELTVTLKLDGTAFETYTETYGDGDHVLTINHIITMEVDGIHTITAEISMNGGDLT